MSIRENGTPNDPRAIPGGATPSRTPGATGPSTRDIGGGTQTDVSEARIRQTEIAGRIQEQPRRPQP